MLRKRLAELVDERDRALTAPPRQARIKGERS
jgi:hypothetical protein